MPEESIVYLIRHGATKFNVESGQGEDRIRGHIDVPLTDEGKEEAHNLAHELEDKGIEKIYSSDLQRAKVTADIIAKDLGLKVQVRYGLRPWKLGTTIEGESSRVVAPKIGKYARDPDTVPPDGESFNKFKRRFLSTYDAIVVPGTVIAVVTHYRTVKLLEARQDKTDKIDLYTFLSHDDEGEIKPGGHGTNTGSVRMVKDGKFEESMTP